MKNSKTGKQQQLKQAMLTCARERVLYLNTLTHHADMLNYTLLMPYSIIIIQYFYCRWSKTSTEDQQTDQGCRHKLKKLFSEYCRLQRDCGEDMQHTLNNVCDLKSSFWASSDHTYSYSTDPCTVIPPANQWRLLELHKLYQRAKEERELLVAKFIQRVEFYQRHFDETVSQHTCTLAAKDCQLLKLQLERARQVCSAVVQAYWCEFKEAESLLNAARKQCMHEVLLPTEPLHVKPSPFRPDVRANFNSSSCSSSESEINEHEEETSFESSD